MVLVLGLAGLNACKKEMVSEVVPEGKVGNMGVSDRESETGFQTRTQNFKTQLDTWRSGNNLTETTDAVTTVENMESVFNYYSGNAAKAYSWGRVYYDSISIAGTNLTWNGSKSAQVFEQVKAKIASYYNAVNGPNKGIRMVSLGVPQVSSGETKIYLYVEVGHTPIREVPPVQEFPGLKWASNYNFPTLCTAGAANNDIAEAVNAQLGIYIGNISPTFNPPADPCTVVTGIVTCRVNETAATGPGTITISARRYQDFPTGASAGTNNDYSSRGQFRIHFDREGNEPCFSIPKYSAYLLDNLWVGNFFLPRVRQVRGNDYQFVSTVVFRQFDDLGLEPVLGGNITINHQHPTVFFYGRVLTVCRPAEDMLTINEI